MKLHSTKYPALVGFLVGVRNSSPEWLLREESAVDTMMEAGGERVLSSFLISWHDASC